MTGRAMAPIDHFEHYEQAVLGTTLGKNTRKGGRKSCGLQRMVNSQQLDASDIRQAQSSGRAMSAILTGMSTSLIRSELRAYICLHI